MNRRDLLKFFGAGAIVAPVVGNTVVGEAVAKLIEVPKVEAFSTIQGLSVNRLYEGCFPSNPFTGADLRVKDPIPVWVKGIEKAGHVVSMSVDSGSTMVDVTTWGDAYRQYAPALPEIIINLRLVVGLEVVGIR